jgi:hypothetical protein
VRFTSARPSDAMAAWQASRTFAAVAFTWAAAAPHRRQLVAAIGRRAAALSASGVDVTVIDRGDGVPAEMLAGCRLARDKDGPEVMRGLLEVLARRGVGPGLLLVGSDFGRPGGEPGPDALLQVPEAARVTAVSVGQEPGGAPAGVIHARAGCSASAGCLPTTARPGHAGGTPSTSRSAAIPRRSSRCGSHCSSCGARSGHAASWRSAPVGCPAPGTPVMCSGTRACSCFPQWRPWTRRPPPR